MKIRALNYYFPTECDIAIVGAGPAGSATAIRLAQSGQAVVLLERSEFNMPRVGESLAPGVQPLLKDLGVWPRFADLSPFPSYGTRSCWGSSDSEKHSHLITRYGNGWHVDRLAFDQMLASAAIAAGAILYTGSRIVASKPVNGGFVLDFVCNNQTRRLHAKFLIDASGRSSVLASRLKAEKIVFDRLVSIGAHFDDDEAGDNCYTLVESVPEGWWYVAPASPGRSMVMLMTDGDLIKSPPGKLFREWYQALERTTQVHRRVRGRSLIWGPKIFSAISQRTMKSAGDVEPWLAVGDASLSVDPISGSGVIRALRTAAGAASTTIAVLNGDQGAINRYETDRNDECAKYLAELGSYYNMEKRWPDAIFWRRRSIALMDYVSEM